MGIFDFFKNKKAEEFKPKKLAFSEIGDWIKNKRNETSIKEKEILELISERNNGFISEIKEKIQTLKEVDIESKKAEERFKVIVNESRNKYIEFIETFIENLDNLKKDSLEECIYNINKLFLNFNKRLHISYEKTTILIGKEMADIKNCLKDFSKDLKQIFDENKETIGFSNTLSLLESKLNQIKTIEESIHKVEETIDYLNKEIADKKEEDKKLLKEIERTKKSTNYLEYLKEKEKLRILEENLKKDFLSLKQLIDFKTLAKLFHIDNEKMNLLNFHKENFQASFQKDNGVGLLNLLNEANLNNESILEKTKQIKFKKEEISKIKQEIKKDEVDELSSKSIETILKINDLEVDKFREEKRYEKLKTNKEDLISSIKQEMKGFGVELDY